MDDISNGRINCENLTDDEWGLLTRLQKIGDWYIPTDDEWLVVAGILALVDIRRGYRDVDEETTQMGWPHIKINVDGSKALSFRRDGKVYKKGRPATLLDVLENPVMVTCEDCEGSGIRYGEYCVGCNSKGFLPY